MGKKTLKIQGLILHKSLFFKKKFHFMSMGVLPACKPVHNVYAHHHSIINRERAHL